MTGRLWHALRGLELVDDARHLWRRWSTRIAASQVALVALYVSLPDKWQDAIPQAVLAVLAGIFALSIISAQAVKQKPPSGGAGKP